MEGKEGVRKGEMEGGRKGRKEGKEKVKKTGKRVLFKSTHVDLEIRLEQFAKICMQAP